MPHNPIERQVMLDQLLGYLDTLSDADLKQLFWNYQSFGVIDTGFVDEHKKDKGHKYGA